MKKILLIILGCYMLQAEAQQLPVPFLPEIFSTFPNVRDLSISADGNEIYFTGESFKKEFSAIYVLKKTNGKWSTLEVAPFSGQYRDLEPFLSPDQLTLYFVSTRPVNGMAKKDADIWFVKRKDTQSAWSAAQHLDAAHINTLKDEYYPAVAASGNLYFTRESEDPIRKEDIFISTFSNGQYAVPVALSDSINGNHFEFNAYVSPDEKYLLFSSFGRPSDMGGSDLYISRKNINGEWTAARHLGPINSKKIDYCPFIDWQNKILYFTSERNAVRTQFDAPQNALQLDTEFYQYANGQGRIYSVPFDPQ